MKKYSAHIKLLILLLLLIGLHIPSARSQPHIGEMRPYLYQDLPIDASGPSEKVYDCVEDRNGFVWLATWSGLYRFDGSEYLGFKNTFGDSTTIVSDNLEKIVIDSKDRLWIVSSRGLIMFDTHTHKSKAYINSKFSFSKEKLRSVFVDNDNYLWIGTSAALHRFDTSEERVIDSWPILNPQSINISEDGFFNIRYDRYKNNYLIGHTAQSIFNLNLETGEMQNVVSFTRDDKAWEDVSEFLQVSPHRYLVSNNHNLLRDIKLDLRGNVIGEKIIAQNSELDRSKRRPTDLQWISDTTFLLSTQYEGVLIGKKLGDDFVLEPFNIEYIPTYNRFTEAICIMSTGDILLAGSALTLLYPNPIGAKVFKYQNILGQSEDNFENLLYDPVYERFYSSTLLAGKFYIERNNLSKVIPLLPRPIKQLSQTNIVQVISDPRGNVYFHQYNVAKRKYEIEMYDPTTSKLSIVNFSEWNDTLQNPQAQGLSINSLDQNLLICTDNSGIIAFDPVSTTFEEFMPAKVDGQVYRYYTVLITDDRIYAGTDLGMLSASRERTSWHLSKSKINDIQGSILPGNVNYIIQLSDGQIACNSLDAGVSVFDPDSTPPYQFEVFPKTINIGYSHYTRMLESNGKLYVVGYLDATIIDLKQQSQVEISLDALLHPRTYISGMTKDENDQIFISNNCRLLRLEKELRGRIVRPDNVFVERIIDAISLDKISHMPSTDEVLKIDRSRNSISIKINQIGFLPTDRKPLYYRLSGVEQDWKKVARNSNITYASLKPGEYNFQIRSDVDEKLGKLVEYPISILPFFYETWWFKTLLAALLALLIYALIRRRESALIREQQLKAEYDKQIASLEMQALRSQMNPHFLFNSLNSIKFYVIKKERVQAARYIDDFSKLMRTVLQNSRKQLIPLHSEIEALTLYLKVEQQRLDHKFEYEVLSDLDLAHSDMNIPPLLLQPYAENAIWHGLMPKDGDGRLSIEINGDDEEVSITIQDNGIGRKASAELNEGKIRSGSKKNSLGLKLTEKRMKISATTHNLKIKTKTDDLYYNGKASGTRVTVTITHNTNEDD